MSKRKRTFLLRGAINMVWKALITLVILFIIYCIIFIIYIHIRYRRMTYSNFCGSVQMHISRLVRCFYSFRDFVHQHDHHATDLCFALCNDCAQKSCYLQSSR